MGRTHNVQSIDFDALLSSSKNPHWFNLLRNFLEFSNFFNGHFLSFISDQIEFRVEYSSNKFKWNLKRLISTRVRKKERDSNKIYRQLLPVVPIQLIIFPSCLLCVSCMLYHITKESFEYKQQPRTWWYMLYFRRSNFSINEKSAEAVAKHSLLHVRESHPNKINSKIFHSTIFLKNSS